MSEEAAGSAQRILEAWVELERALRSALPVCSVAPPTQPVELLSALRINHRIGEAEEEEIMDLRETRNRVAYDPAEPEEELAREYETRVARVKAILAQALPGPTPTC
jgi:hypothetical protein